mmetsp:Transcript_85365/g.169321  ORF Transcript_85365/g.169321 Transcript_85365/m.169321 type:complete len:860 (-) Transcript_85365:285-2864(-)
MVTAPVAGRRRNVRLATTAFETAAASEDATTMNEPRVLYGSLLAMAKASLKAGCSGDGMSQSALFPEFYARARARRRDARLSNERCLSLTAEHRMPGRPRYEQSVPQPPRLESSAQQIAESAPGTQASSASEVETCSASMATPVPTCTAFSLEDQLEDTDDICSNNSFGVHWARSSENHGEPDQSCGLQWTTTCPREELRRVTRGGGSAASTSTKKRPQSAFATLYSVLKQDDGQGTVASGYDVGLPSKAMTRRRPSTASGMRRPNSALGHQPVAVAQLRAQPRLGIVGIGRGRQRDARPSPEELGLGVDPSTQMLDQQQHGGALFPSHSPAWSTRFQMHRVSAPTRPRRQVSSSHSPHKQRGPSTEPLTNRPATTGSTPQESVEPLVVASNQAGGDPVASSEVVDTTVESLPLSEETASRMSMNTNGDRGRPPLVHRGRSSPSSWAHSGQTCSRPQGPEAVLSAHRELRRANSTGAEVGAVLGITLVDTGDSPELLKQRLCELRRAQAALQGMGSGRTATACVSQRTIVAIEHKMQLLVELADCTASYREVASKRDQMLQAIESNVGGETEEPQLSMAARLDNFLQTSVANCTKRSSAQLRNTSSDRRCSSRGFRLHSPCISGLPVQHIAVVQARVLLQQEGHAWAVKVLERAKAVATAAKQVAQRVENNQHLLRRSSSDGCNNPSSVVEGMVALATKLGVPKEHPHLQDAWNLAVELRLAEIQHVLQAEQLRAVRAAGGVDRGEAHAEAASHVEAAVRAASDFGVSWEQLGPFANAAVDLRAESARRLAAGQVEYSCGGSSAVREASVQRVHAAIEAAVVAGVPRDHQGIKEARRLAVQIREEFHSRCALSRGSSMQ